MVGQVTSGVSLQPRRSVVVLHAIANAGTHDGWFPIDGQFTAGDGVQPGRTGTHQHELSFEGLMLQLLIAQTALVKNLRSSKPFRGLLILDEEDG